MYDGSVSLAAHTTLTGDTQILHIKIGSYATGVNWSKSDVVFIRESFGNPNQHNLNTCWPSVGIIKHTSSASY